MDPIKNHEVLAPDCTCQNLLVVNAGKILYILGMDIYKLKIKEIRKLKGMTQKELAHKIGISQNFLSEVESGAYDIRVSLLLKLAIALNVTHPGDLIECDYNHDYYI